MNRRKRWLYPFLAMAATVVWGCDRQPTGQPEAPAPPQPVVTASELQAGAALFRQYCSPCHPDGGNVSNPERTLHASALRAHHIDRPEDIVKIMRHPISRMIRFDETTVSDRDARAIAVYILNTF